MMANVQVFEFSYGGETMVVLVVVLILIGSRFIGGFARGLGQALDAFGKASSDVVKEIDQTGFDTGRSLGGIHGKPAFEAMTADNRNVELYDPAVFRNKAQKARWKKISKIACSVGIGLLVLAILWHIID